MYWVYNLPSWLFALLILTVFVGFGLGGILLTRRWIHHVHVQRSHNDIVGFYLAGVTVLYGVTVGLVAFGAWTTYTDTEAKVAREASALGALYRSVADIPEPARSVLRNDLREYTRQVIDVGWPQQRRGVQPFGTEALLDRFQRDLDSFEPATEEQRVLAGEASKLFDELEESRSVRLDSVTEELPAPLWVLILAGASVCLQVTWFFHMESRRMHLWMTSFLAVVLGLMTFMVASLDNPYRGNVSVSAAPFERVYKEMMRPGA